MDQLKPYLQQLKKHHFWVLCCVTIATALFGWFAAKTALSDVFRSAKSKIVSEFSELQQITSILNHPNHEWAKGVDNMTLDLKNRVGVAWSLVYDEQKDSVLIWPAELGNDFVGTMQTLGPNDEIPVELRERYHNYAKEEFPRLLKIIDARSHTDKGPVLSGGEGRPLVKRDVRAEPEHDYKVIWSPSNQNDVEAMLDWSQTPTSLEVRQAQENLWVYRALLEIINKVNDRATGHHNAKIKEIQSLLIGQAAAQEFLSGTASGRIMRPAQGANVAVAPAGVIPEPQGGENAQHAALDDRYVDARGKPLAANAAAPPEFKRMPVYMRLVMDQREVSQLLIACANSPLPVEIRQLRLNSKGVQGAFARGGRRGGRGGMDGLRGPEIVGAGMERNDDEQNPYDMPIELHGIIYIFNPPDRNKLGQPAPGTVPAAAVDPAAAVPPADGAAPQPADKPPAPVVPEAAPAVPADPAVPAVPPAAGVPGAAPSAVPPAVPPAAGAPTAPPAAVPAAAPAGAAVPAPAAP